MFTTLHVLFIIAKIAAALVLTAARFGTSSTRSCSPFPYLYMYLGTQIDSRRSYGIYTITGNCLRVTMTTE